MACRCRPQPRWGPARAGSRDGQALLAESSLLSLFQKKKAAVDEVSRAVPRVEARVPLWSEGDGGLSREAPFGARPREIGRAQRRRPLRAWRRRPASARSVRSSVRPLIPHTVAGHRLAPGEPAQGQQGDGRIPGDRAGGCATGCGACWRGLETPSRGDIGAGPPEQAGPRGAGQGGHGTPGQRCVHAKPSGPFGKAEQVCATGRGVPVAEEVRGPRGALQAQGADGRAAVQVCTARPPAAAASRPPRSCFAPCGPLPTQPPGWCW